MSEAKHTPGPWDASCAPFDMAVTAIRDGKRVDILGARAVGSCGSEEEANVTLAAAAPDMLAALELQVFAELYWSNDCPDAEDHDERMPELCEHCFPHFDNARVARLNAIAKAKGEAWAT